MRKLRTGSVTDDALQTIIQLGMINRRALAVTLYKIMPDGTTIQYRQSTVAMSRAIAWLKEKGYIKEVTYGGKRYLMATELGKSYATEKGLPDNPALAELSAENVKHRKTIVDNAEAISIARSMRIYALPSEKPTYSALANSLGAITVFDDKDCYDKHDLVEMLTTGLAYSRREIRYSYENSLNDALTNNSSQRIGMVFRLHYYPQSDVIQYGETITLYKMASKNAILTVRAENEFEGVVKKDFAWAVSELATKAYILVPSMNYLPTFFHGAVDGIEAKNEFKRPVKDVDENLTKFKIDKLPLYNKIYLMPIGESHTEYRQAVDSYTDDDYARDEAEFEKLHPGETNVILCRFPELMSLRKAYANHDHCTIVGPGDQKTVDLLSRCMRNRLIKYYDIDSGEEVPFKRYNSKGLPLVKNTDQIDYKAPWKLGGKFKKKD